MNYNNLYVSAYIDKLCSQFDDSHESPSQIAFRELKEILPEKEFAEIANFNFHIRAFRHLYMADEHPDNMTAHINKYETAVENSGLPNKYKADLYNSLLLLYEKNKHTPHHYFEILNKLIDLYPHGDDHSLGATAQRAVFAHRSVQKSVYLKTLQRAYNKFKHPERFPRLDELGFVTESNAKNKIVIVPLKKLSKDAIRKRLDIIQEILKNDDLSSEEKINLGKEAIEYATKTPFSKTKNFEIKRDMSRMIAEEYRNNGNLDMTGKYEREVQRWQKNIDLAMDKGYERSGKNFFYR